MSYCKSWNENGKYSIQFETDDPDKFAFVEQACRCVFEGKIPDAWQNANRAKNELMKLLDAGNCNNCAMTFGCKFCPKPGEPVRANCPLFVQGRKRL